MINQWNEHWLCSHLLICFLILFIKYYDFSLVSLCFKFFSLIFRNLCLAFVKAINNKMLIKLILEIFCFIWIVYCLYGVHRFKNSQRADFVSEGESLIDIQKLSDLGVTFLWLMFFRWQWIIWIHIEEWWFFAYWWRYYFFLYGKQIYIIKTLC